MLDRSLRANYFLVAAFSFLAVAIAVHPIYSVDYFEIQFAPRRYEWIIGGDMRSGRYLSALGAYVCQVLGLDTSRDYPLFVGASAATAGLFLRRVYLDFLRLPASLWWFAFVCISFFFSGAMLDLLSFREVPHHTPAMFLAAYLFLAAADIRSTALRMAACAISVAVNFAIYQPAVVMLVVLVLLRAMFRVGGQDGAKDAIRDVAAMAVAFAIGTALYVGMKLGVEATTRFRIMRPMLDFRDAGSVKARAVEHAHMLLALFQTPSERYKWAHIGLGLLAAFVSYAWALRAVSWRQRAAGVGLCVAVIMLLQNPMNVLVAAYWPTPRSSFYWAIVPGLILAYVFANAVGRREAIGRYIGGVLMALYLGAATVLLTDGYELRRRDQVLAHDIVEAIRANPDLSTVTKIKLPGDWSSLLRAYYTGVDNLSFDAGAPALYASWTAIPFLYHTTGLQVTYAGKSECGPIGPVPRLRVTVQDGIANVCFQ